MFGCNSHNLLSEDIVLGKYFINYFENYSKDIGFNISIADENERFTRGYPALTLYLANNEILTQEEYYKRTNALMTAPERDLREKIVDTANNFMPIIDKMRENIPEQFHKSNQRKSGYGDFSPAEKREIVKLLKENRLSFNFEQCYKISKRPDFYRELPRDSEEYNHIINNFNTKQNHEIDARLILFRDNFPWFPLSREFITEALLSTDLDKRKIEEMISEDLYDVLTYDNPPTEEEYWSSYKKAEKLLKDGIKNVKIFSIEGLPEVFNIECECSWTKGKRTNQHCMKDGDVFRPIYIPDSFRSAGDCIYLPE